MKQPVSFRSKIYQKLSSVCDQIQAASLIFAKEKRRTSSRQSRVKKKKKKAHTLITVDRLIINVEPNLKIESHALKKITLKLHNIQSSYIRNITAKAFQKIEYLKR